MTEQEAVSYIEAYTWSKTRLGLERTKELLARLGDPQKQLKFIHIAGSNGKGSASAMLASVFRVAGYRTGLYISPYILDFRERIQLNGVSIPPEALSRITERVKTEAEAMEDHPSQFELVTAIGMLYFLEEKADIVMLEVGMGGALDSTNAIDAPECALIMNIGLEHTEYLGHTLTEIAGAKCGIFKIGCDAVVYRQSEEVLAVARRVAAEKNIPLHIAGTEGITPLGHTLRGQTFSYESETYTLPLLGEHQLHNAAVVLKTVEVMRSRGWTLPAEAVRKGIALVRWPARFEVLSEEPLFILDGGHNPQCADALFTTLRAYCPDTRFTFIMGVLRDKDLSEMLDFVTPFAAAVLAVTPDSPRALEAKELAAAVEARGVPAQACASLRDAVEEAFSRPLPMLAFGSLYMAGEIRGLVLNRQRAALRLQKQQEAAGLPEETRKEYSARIDEALSTVHALTRKYNMMAYRAVSGEADVSAAAQRALDAFMSVGYPGQADGRTESLFPCSDRVFIKDSAGRERPDPIFSLKMHPEDLDAVLLPAAAFTKDGLCVLPDDDGVREFLDRCPQAKRIAVAFSCRKADFPAAQADFQADMIVTETGTAEY